MVTWKPDASFYPSPKAAMEAPPERLAELCASPLREELLAELRAAGFRYATLDLAGFRSGSLNEVLPVESLRVLE